VPRRGRVACKTVEPHGVKRLVDLRRSRGGALLISALPISRIDGDRKRYPSNIVQSLRCYARADLTAFTM